MKLITFWRNSSITKYWKKHFSADTLYSVVGVRSLFGVWKGKIVVFYQKQDVVKLLEEAIFDLVQQELSITIKSCLVRFDSWENHQAKIDLATDNDKLLIGKFNQNQQSLEACLSLFLSNHFKVKYEVKLQFFPHKNDREKTSIKKNRTTKF